MVQINDGDNSDLLILSDDDANFDTLVFDDTNNSENNSTDSELITFDDDSLDLSLDSDSLDIDDTDKNLDIDLSNMDIDLLSTETNVNVDNNEINIQDSIEDNFDLDFSNLQVEDKLVNLENNENIKEKEKDLFSNNFDTIVEEKIEIEEKIDNSKLNIEPVGKMVDILDKAIHEMSSRSEVIVSEIENEEKSIFELKEKISILESQVISSQNLVSELNDEKNMISKNIKSLEKMKLIEHNTQKETKTKTN